MGTAADLGGILSDPTTEDDRTGSTEHGEVRTDELPTFTVSKVLT